MGAVHDDDDARSGVGRGTRVNLSTNDVTERQLIDFVVKEARLLDEKR